MVIPIPVTTGIEKAQELGKKNYICTQISVS